MIHDGIELIGVEAPVIGTALVMPRIFSQIVHTVGRILGFFLLLAAKSVMLYDVI